MSWRRKGTTPSVTELTRIEKVLEGDPAIRRWLGPKTSPATKRSGELLYFAPETVAVAEALVVQHLSPERAPVGKVLLVAVEVLGIGSRRESVTEVGSQ